MKTFIIAAFFAGASIAPSFAVPLAKSDSTPVEIIKVAGGCGAGWHRGPNGGCLKNFADPSAHACPRGYHIGPGGDCKGNGK